MIINKLIRFLKKNNINFVAELGNTPNYQHDIGFPFAHQQRFDK